MNQQHNNQADSGNTNPSRKCIVVHESFQRQGIGRLLVQRVHAWMREQSVTDIELDVYEFNTPARTLYERLGYETTRRTMRHRLDGKETNAS